MLKRLSALLIVLVILTSCVPTTPEANPVSTATSAPVPAPTNWWQDAVFYEIFVRSFYDSDGDGIGDFNGITAKLDYLNDGDPATDTDLGITGLWLMPIFPSPSYHGYDVTDYYAVNPQYGTMDDFRNLVNEAHKRSIHIVIDLVINHTSDQHPWFKDAKRNVNSPYRNWYIWSEAKPDYEGPWNQNVWHSSTTGFYYGIFQPFMPDLNYENPEVTAEMTKVYSFWLQDIGVDGFRLDAAKHLIEEGAQQENTDATHAWYQQMYPVYKQMNPNAMTVGELFGDSMSVAENYVNDREFDLIFNFQLAATILKSVQAGRAKTTSQMIDTSNKFLPEFQYAPFLTNHDQNRVMNELGNDVNKARVAASVMLTAPGTPFIYYGEEIGMSGAKPDENIRRPMQWTADKNGGFTSGKPWRALDTNFTDVNVQQQSSDSESLLSHYRALIQTRMHHEALRTGQYYIIKSNAPQIYAALRVSADEVILVLVNLSGGMISDFKLSLSEAVLTDGHYASETLYGGEQAQALDVSGGAFQNYKPMNELQPYSTVIVQFAR